MNRTSRAALCLAASLAMVGCSASATSRARSEALATEVTQSEAFEFVDPYAPVAAAQADRGSDWRKGQALGQGYLGINSFTEFERTGGRGLNVTGDGGSVDQYPVIGGGFQWKMGGSNVDLGLEALLALGGRANGGAFVIGGGGAAVAVSLDLFVVDVFGGPFLSVPLGERARVYGAVGPLIQFASYHQSPTFLTNGSSGTGFGFGGYARAGVEFELSSGSLIGIGVRWYDTEVDLSGGLGDLALQGVETALTFSVFR